MTRFWLLIKFLILTNRQYEISNPESKKTKKNILDVRREKKLINF